jgi:hypothetical protein
MGGFEQCAYCKDNLIEVAVENVADSRLAANRHPLPNQVSDIPVHRPLRHLQLRRQLASGDRPARPPQRKLVEVIGDSLVQEPTTMPWGNRSLLFRDPDGTLINFFTPISAEAIRKFAR